MEVIQTIKERRSINFFQPGQKPSDEKLRELLEIAILVPSSFKGYCPGTAVRATGEGRFNALWGGVLGMLVGAGIFAEVYPLIEGNVLKWGDFGKLSIPKWIGIHHWIVIAIAWAIILLTLMGLKKKKL